MTNRKTGRIACISLLGSILLYLVLSSAFISRIRQPMVVSLKRESYGGQNRSVPVTVNGFFDKGVNAIIHVRPREYTRMEAEELFGEVMEELWEEVLAGNESLLSIRSDLKLITRPKREGIELSWRTDIPDHIDQFGQVTNVGVPGEGIQGNLLLQMQAGTHKVDYEIPICVLPPIYDARERMLNEFLETLAVMDREQSTQPQLELPKNYQGKTLDYYSDRKNDYRIIPILGALAAVLLVLMDKERGQKKQREREQQLLMDYAEVVTKLMVFIGAGMTVRLAWERIVKDYQIGLENGRQKKRYAYEEMSYICQQMQSKMAEGRAYREFGERCRLQPYLKLSSLLEQNRKTGTKNLRELMRKEVEDAFEQRKQLAKRLGEEASTKLTAPLFLSLGTIMIIILFPAMMTIK